MVHKNIFNEMSKNFQSFFEHASVFHTEMDSWQDLYMDECAEIKPEIGEIFQEWSQARSLLFEEYKEMVRSGLEYMEHLMLKAQRVAGAEEGMEYGFDRRHQEETVSSTENAVP